LLNAALPTRRANHGDGLRHKKMLEVADSHGLLHTAKVQRQFNIEQAPWTMKIKEQSFPYSIALHLDPRQLAAGGKTYDELQGHTS
jgi:hypothetical protein